MADHDTIYNEGWAAAMERARMVLQSRRDEMATAFAPYDERVAVLRKLDIIARDLNIELTATG